MRFSLAGWKKLTAILQILILSCVALASQLSPTVRVFGLALGNDKLTADATMAKRKMLPVDAETYIVYAEGGSLVEMRWGPRVHFAENGAIDEVIGTELHCGELRFERRQQRVTELKRQLGDPNKIFKGSADHRTYEYYVYEPLQLTVRIVDGDDAKLVDCFRMSTVRDHLYLAF